METIKKVILLLLIIVFVNGCNAEDDDISVLRGTFVSSELPFSSFVFDPDNHNRFYFYYQNDEKVDIGTFTKITNTKYKINSKKFKKKEIKVRKYGFEITIYNKTYIFKQISSLPTIQE